MPLSKYYKGHGEQVMRDMQDRYGGKRGRSIFYATANKRGMAAGGRGAARREALRRMRKKRHG